jgi:addiction module HigA family antidote
MKTKKLAPIHPGEILREGFMKPRDLSQNALARALNVPPRRINEIVMEMRSITADTALRLARSEKERQIERDVEPLSQIQPAMA